MFQNAYLKTKELIETFKANESHYISPAYVEARVRQDFIDKLFTALGWDVLHDFQKNPFEQEVKVEKPQRQEGHQAQKRADYAFYLAPDFKKVQFFVEAKKPSRTLRQNRDDYFQTAKYGWNSQTGISILTDFEEIVMIDCRFKPDFDTILSNEIKYYKYLDLLEEDKFSEFYWLFSREAVDAGNLTKFVENLPQPKGKAKKLKLFGGRYQSIDDSFLDYIDDIRLQMAQAFYQNNPTLDHYDLTEATQRTIDRLVFIRFLEDKQIEPEDLMHGISTSEHPWRKFIELSKRLDAKYNGVVFKEHFIDKNAFLGANEELFKNIAQDLDHTNTPYDFNYIPIHILGNIYERFLGKIIVVEDGKARIELKPEVRKAGGVFYTPKYIVDYIVENTVGKKIADKKPKEISKLKFADIACGSGSFLIGVYDFLLDHYKKYYNQNPDEAKKDGCIYDTENQLWVLSIRQKQQILLDNVFGVDIDLQATEVSQVSLFLKLLEDETMATANDMNVLFAEKILPDLSGNIKCGNSLIGYEIMDGVLEFGKEEMRKLNPFDFEQAFPTVFSGKSKGFDCIVGNPPYLKELGNKEIFQPVLRGNLGKKYYQGKMDFWYFFAHKAIEILNKEGFCGIITNSYWMKSDGASKLINRLQNDTSIFEIVYFDDYKVFEDVSGKHNILVFQNGKKKYSKVLIKRIIDKKSSISENSFENIYKSQIFNNGKINIFEDFNLDTGLLLGDKYSSSIGVQESVDKISKKQIEQTNNQNFNIGDGVFVLNLSEVESLSLNEEEKTVLKPYLNSNHIGRYSLKFNNEYLLYLDKASREKVASGKFPNIKSHLDNVQEFITSSNKPYGIHRPREKSFFESPKVICVGMFKTPSFYYDVEKYYCGFSFSLITQNTEEYSLKSLIGLMNSKVGEFWFNQNGKKRGIGVDVGVKVFRQFPIPKITPENQALHDALVKLVEQMLQAKKDEQNAVTDHDKNFYRNLTQSLDNRINKTVYQLYNLTDQEIALVEGN